MFIISVEAKHIRPIQKLIDLLVKFIQEELVEKGPAVDNIRKRDKNHHMNKKGFGPAQLDKSSKNKDAIRGREQILINKHGGAKLSGGKSGNAINGIGNKNKKRVKYIRAGLKEFGR